MARAQHAGPSTLRNRNRVTNKTRLKIIKESIDADPIVLDEDEEKARVVSTAGVDAEDANEHHLQAVLSAAATRHHTSARSTRGTEKEPAQPAAYIPTPDSTGKVDNYEDLYPPGRWKDPVTYLKSSDTIEEAVSFALANGFIYYMDERDEEWLHKNNEEARGEGTSTQGAVSGTSTRSSRNSKKGKDPEGNHSVVISEDEFELIMAIFEKVTHEKTEFLHHGLESGSPFPPFSDYQDTFATPLAPTMFALFTVPGWVPQPQQLLKSALAIYPHWKERRIERGGHPIIPTVNLDETDTKNESYICFRRRESKAVRKTRAQQATYSDKMIRLQQELAAAMDLAKGVLQRETCKKDLVGQTKTVWEARFNFADLKRKFPSLGTKEDEELFVDRERVLRKPKTERLGLRIRPAREAGDYGSPSVQEPTMPPKERYALIKAQVEEEVKRLKKRDENWENVIDNPYQPPPVPYASRLFKFISANRSSSSDSSSVSSSSTESTPHRDPRAIRVRVGRGGRMLIDRRLPRPPVLNSDSEEDVESRRRLKERWAYDTDDVPPVGPEGQEEHDRKLVDDFAIPHLLHSMSMLTEQDVESLAPENKEHTVVPFRMNFTPMRSQRSAPSPLNTPPNITSVRHANGTPIAMQTPISSSRTMLPPQSVPQSRTPSNGIIRPPLTPTLPTIPQHSPPPPQSSPTPMVNGNGQADHNGDQELKLTSPTPVALHAASPGQPDDVSQTEIQMQGIQLTSPVRKSQTPSMVPMQNGYAIPMNNVGSNIANGATYPLHAGLRVNGMKSALASHITDGSNGAHMSIRQAPYIGHTMPANANYSAQLAAARQMQWANLQSHQQQQAQQMQQQQRVASVDGSGDAMVGVSLSPPLSAPPRTPSANGARPVALSRGLSSPALAQAMAAGQGRASPQHIARLASHQLSPGLPPAHASPPRPQPLPSPSLQARQIVGSSGGY